MTSLNGGSVTYVYDGDGNRVAKTVGGVTTNFLVDTNNPTGYAQVVDELQNGSVIRSFTYGHDLISQRCAPVTATCSLAFYQYDGHGSVRQLTNASGAITDAYDYDAFGNLIYRSGTTPNDYLYCGEQFDPSSYGVMLKWRMQIGTVTALLSRGGIDNSIVYNVPALQYLPQIREGDPNQVHIKYEKGAITYGLRRNTVSIFNDRIKSYRKIGQWGTVFP